LLLFFLCLFRAFLLVNTLFAISLLGIPFFCLAFLGSLFNLRVDFLAPDFFSLCLLCCPLFLFLLFFPFLLGLLLLFVLLLGAPLLPLLLFLVPFLLALLLL